MNTKHNIITFLVASLFTASISMAADVDDSTEVLAAKQQTKKIDALKKLPGGSFSLIKTGEKTYLISENGRFVVANPIIMDVWNQKKIKTFEDAADVDKLNLKKLGLKDEDLASYSYGSGKQEVTIFLDPQCPHCSAVTNQVAALKDQYKFNFVPLPLLGEKSTDIVKKMECSKNNSAVIDSILSRNYVNLPAMQEGCSLERLKKTLVVSTLIGIQGVPFTILPNGKTVSGRIDNLAQTISKNLN